MADSAVIRYSDETAPMLDTIVEVAIGADDEVKEEEEDDGMSLDSEYDEGPLDGKVMQIYLPDVAPMAAASQDEDTEAVQILKLDNYESEEAPSRPLRGRSEALSLYSRLLPVQKNRKTAQMVWRRLRRLEGRAGGCCRFWRL